MRKLFQKLSPNILVAFVLLAFFLIPQPAHAGLFSIADFAQDGILRMVGYLLILVLQVIGLVTYLAGIVLNHVIYLTVVTMADKVNAGPINDAWKTIRDVANMGFIFVLLYAGIQMILGLGKNTQKLIVNVIVVAILINFSLFFTKVVIDFSNVLAVLFYGAMAPGAVGENYNVMNAGLSNTLMRPLGIQSILQSTSGIDGYKLVVIGVMGSVVALVAAFVFFAIAIMFVIRFVVLIFVMILSPVAFMAFILPQLGKYKDQWLDALLGQAFFAPVYFMLTWIVIKISPSLTPANGSWGDIVRQEGTGGVTKYSPGPGGAELIVMYLVLIALLIASLVMAKKYADKAGSIVSDATKWATGAAGTATMGTAGWAGRRTVGAWGTRAANDEDLKAKAASGGVGSIGARLKLAAANKSASSTFDARNTETYKRTSKITGVDLGKAGGKGGYSQTLKDRQDVYKKRYGKLKPSGDAINALDTDEKAKKSNLEAAQQAAEREFEATVPKDSTLIEAEKKLSDLKNDSLGALRPEYENEVKAAEDALKKEQGKRDSSRESFVGLRTVVESASHSQAAQKKKEIDKRMENMAERLETGFTGTFMRGKEKAKAIRSLAKEKSKKEKFDEAAAELAKEEAAKKAEEEAKKNPPAPNTSPIT